MLKAIVAIEIQNSKHEIRNKHECQNTNYQNSKLEFGKLKVSNLFRISKFGFRIL